MKTEPFSQTGQMIELCCEYLSVQWVSLKLQVSRSSLNKEFLDVQATIECRFNLKCVRGMITYSHMHCTDKYSQHSSIIWSVWLNGWVFVYGLSGCGFESRCCHLNLPLHLFAEITYCYINYIWHVNLILERKKNY